MQHIKSLDGIRGLSVSLVVLFHAGLLPAGWIGVQIFFVLSGFLITGILLREKERSLGEYLGRFYWRRSLRIFPLYFAFLAISAAVYMAAGEPQSLAVDWPYLVSYTTNFGRLRQTDVGPAFVHLWSLAVEEQFYLIWPLLVYFLPLIAFKRLVLAILVLSPLVRLALYFLFKDQSPDWIGRAIYGLPISQFDAFAAGAAIVVWRLTDLKSAGRWFVISLFLVAACGAAVLVHQHFTYRGAFKESLGYSMFLLPDFGFVWGYSLLNITAALGIVCAIKRGGFLESLPLVRIGAVSYGIYVYHVPLLMLTHGLPIVISCAIIYAVAEISFRYFERPIMALKGAVKYDERQLLYS